MVRAFRVFVATVAVLWSALGSVSAGAAPLRTFYVDPAGNDSAAGSSVSPWRTLQKAANTVRAGDLVIVRAGHYAGLYLTTSGTATDPITFRGRSRRDRRLAESDDTGRHQPRGRQLRRDRELHGDRRSARRDPRRPESPR